MKKVTLTKWHKNHAYALMQCANHVSVARYLRNDFPYPYTLKDANSFILSVHISGETNACYRAIAYQDHIVGSIGVSIKEDVHCKSGELGYWLAKPFWGHGITTQAIVLMCDYAFKHYDIERIFAETFAKNIGSQRSLEKAGFQLECIQKAALYKDGKYHDSCIYAKTRL